MENETWDETYTFKEIKEAMEGFEPGSITKTRELITRLLPKIKQAVRDEDTERLEGLLKAIQLAVGEKEGQGRTKEEILAELEASPEIRGERLSREAKKRTLEEARIYLQLVQK